jgi:hypothetical protein
MLTLMLHDNIDRIVQRDNVDSAAMSHEKYWLTVLNADVDSVVMEMLKVLHDNIIHNAKWIYWQCCMTLLTGPHEIDDVLHDSLDSTAYHCLTMLTVLHDNVNSAGCATLCEHCQAKLTMAVSRRWRCYNYVYSFDYLTLWYIVYSYYTRWPLHDCGIK